jgi:hypothetical protein
MGWFTYLLYITTWVGENIYHGDPDGTQEEKDQFAVTLLIFTHNSYIC